MSAAEVEACVCVYPSRCFCTAEQRALRTAEHADDCYAWIAGDCTCGAGCPPPESSQPKEGE